MERIEYQELLKEDAPFQWLEPVGFDAGEKCGDAVGCPEQGRKKRPRLEELLGWNLRFEEKEGLETEMIE